jgi:hypothetical protein
LGGQVVEILKISMILRKDDKLKIILGFKRKLSKKRISKFFNILLVFSLIVFSAPVTFTKAVEINDPQTSSELTTNNNLSTEVTANDSTELVNYINQQDISIINLVPETTYKIEGQTIDRELTINGNGAVIEAGNGITDTVVRNDGVTVSGLGDYANVTTFIKIEGSGSILTLNNLTLKNAEQKNGSDNTDDGLFTIVNVKASGSLDLNGVTIEGFHNNPSPGNNLSFGVHAEPGAISTIIQNCKFESSNAFRNAVAIRNGNMMIVNNEFKGTDYPERLRQSDGYEYALYIYGGTGQINDNLITGYDSTTQLGYASAGIAVIGFYPTEVTVENNKLSYNESGIDVTKTWTPYSLNTLMSVNGLTLENSEDAFEIGEALKAANQQEYVSVSLDQNDEVELKDSENQTYYSVLGGYRSPLLSVSEVIGNEAIMHISDSDIDAITAAETIEFERLLDDSITWETVEPTWLESPTKVSFEVNEGHSYNFRLKMTHKSSEEDPAVEQRTLTTFSNPVKINFNATPQAPNVSADDLNNVILGANNTMEYSTDSNNWVSYNDSNIPTFQGNQIVKIRVKALNYAINYGEFNCAPSGQEKTLNFTTNSSYSAPTELVRQVDVKVGDTNNSNNAAKVNIIRKVEPNGKIDSVILDKNKAQEALESAIKHKKDNIKIIIDDIPNDKADEVAVKVDKDSLDKLSGTKISLEIQTDDVNIKLPKDTVKSLNKNDLFFRVVPVRKLDEKESVIENAVKANVVKKLAGASEVIALGTPMKIETNYTKLTTKVTFSLNGINIPNTGKERKEFLSKLAVFIQHSDGEKALDRGKIIYSSDGNPVGIEVEITKFSTFTILSVKNGAPVASGVNVKGKFEVGNVITASYKYSDFDKDVQGKSIVRWYRSNNSKGKGKKLISNATRLTYKLSNVDQGKYLIFEITPVAKTGTIRGKSVSKVIKIQEILYKGHLKLGLIGSEKYAKKIAEIIRTTHKGTNVTVKKEGVFYRVRADFTTKQEAEKAAKNMKNKKLIINYYIS